MRRENLLPSHVTARYTRNPSTPFSLSSTAPHCTIHRALLEQHLPPPVGLSLSCSISLVPSVHLSPLSILVHLSVSLSLCLSPSFYLGLISICLPVSLSLSPPPPRSRRQEKSFVVGLPFLQHLLLALGGDDRAVSMSATPRSGTTTG